MRNYLYALLILPSLLLFSCNESDSAPVEPDFSNCSESIDWSLLLSGPFDKGGTYYILPSVSYTFQIDTVTEGDTLPLWAVDAANKEVMMMEPGDGTYYLVQDAGFTCDKQIDTCWVVARVLTGVSQHVYRGDTVAWPHDAGGFSHAQSLELMCTLDSNGGTSPWGDKYHFRRDAILIDTSSNPAERSLYKHWWPLPKIPWSKGESDWADSMLYREQDSVASVL
jgi:hypothetical protein